MSVTLESGKVFELIKNSVKSDAKGRIALGSDFSEKDFRVAVSANGDILLTPMVSISERDVWLYKNLQALALFQQGLADAAGNVTAGEDFSQYAEDVLEED